MEAHVIKDYFEGTEAFVAQDGFYCKPDFEPPFTCFLSGYSLSETTTPIMLLTKQTNKVHLCFDPVLIRSDSRIRGMITFISFGLLLLVCAAIYFISNIFISMIVGLFITFYVIPKPKSKITINEAPNSFIRITGGHPDFLNLYPKKDFSITPPILASRN